MHCSKFSYKYNYIFVNDLIICCMSLEYIVINWLLHSIERGVSTLGKKETQKKIKNIALFSKKPQQHSCSKKIQSLPSFIPPKSINK